MEDSVFSLDDCIVNQVLKTKIRLQKQTFADVLQNRCSYKFGKIHWENSPL